LIVWTWARTVALASTNSFCLSVWVIPPQSTHRGTGLAPVELVRLFQQLDLLSVSDVTRLATARTSLSKATSSKTA
jgi:hypothetical protein